MLSLPTSYLEFTEEDLEKMFPTPSPIVEKLRRMFWIEFDRAVEQRTMMNMSNVYPGVCTREGFNKLIKKKENLLWLISPPEDYSASVEHLLTTGLKRINEMFTFPLKTKEGNFDAKLGELILKATLALDMRVKGGYLQRSVQLSKIESTNTNTNNISVMVGTDSPTKEGLDLIDEELKKIEESITNRREAIEVKRSSPVNPIIEVQSMAIAKDPKGLDDSEGSA
jgi:hypothetical protein